MKYLYFISLLEAILIGTTSVHAQVPDVDCRYLNQARAVIHDKQRWGVPLTDKDRSEDAAWLKHCSEHQPLPLSELLGEKDQEGRLRIYQAQKDGCTLIAEDIAMITHWRDMDMPISSAKLRIRQKYPPDGRTGPPWDMNILGRVDYLYGSKVHDAKSAHKTYEEQCLDYVRENFGRTRK